MEEKAPRPKSLPPAPNLEQKSGGNQGKTRPSLEKKVGRERRRGICESQFNCGLLEVG